ncbi:MAG: hypothetical protein CMA07_06170 [Euryarchaeota archaeon]|jgi:hypothetical protein|nr:hypothetical protein [Euryarchaeota archaeon]|tara:strand:+ start:515 stop:1507 length:993 start_codon:yes stop_codon:yes gene_type:complete
MSEEVEQITTEGEESVRSTIELEYPRDNRDYQGRIIFNVMKEQETDLGDVFGNIEKLGSKGFKALGDLLESIGSSDGSEMTSFDAKNEELATVVNHRPLTALGRQVSLYLPIGLQYRDNVAYDNMDIGGMGAAAEQGLISGRGAITSMIDGGMKTVAAGLKGAANKDVAKLGAVKLVSALPDEVTGAFKSAAGVTSNPNTRVLFKQVNLREFSFVFKFIPTSKKEADEVKEIVKLFRTELYPENIVLPLPGESAISIGYRFPNKFQIDIEYNGKEIATKIKPCYLRDVGVTYNNTAMSMHSDGNFQETEMTLAFQESRTLNRKDVEEDGF